MKKSLNSEELKRLQKIETDMLVKTAEVCEKLGIKYYLCGGTLLGAIRHKGFIPWDDDIDIAMMSPDSDKTKLAKDRLAKCEVELAKVIARKHGLLDGSKAILKEVEELKEKLKKANEDNAKLAGELDAAKVKADSLQKENNRIMTSVKRLGANEDATASKVDRKAILEAKDLLDSEDPQRGSRTSEIAGAGKLLAGENTGDDRIKNSADIAMLQKEEKAERALASSILPKQPEGAKAARDAAEKAERERKAREKNAEAEKPEFYVVKEGDTLYKIALRFYGRTSAWREIREANKAVISTDGRVNEGQKIKLP